MSKIKRSLIVVGPDGSGKTTLMMQLAMLACYDSHYMGKKNLQTRLGKIIFKILRSQKSKVVELLLRSYVFIFVELFDNLYVIVKNRSTPLIYERYYLDRVIYFIELFLNLKSFKINLIKFIIEVPPYFIVTLLYLVVMIFDDKRIIYLKPSISIGYERANGQVSDLVLYQNKIKSYDMLLRIFSSRVQIVEIDENLTSDEVSRSVYESLDDNGLG
jgi:thymidylate kinase